MAAGVEETVHLKTAEKGYIGGKKNSSLGPCKDRRQQANVKDFSRRR